MSEPIWPRRRRQTPPESADDLAERRRRRKGWGCGCILLWALLLLIPLIALAIWAAADVHPSGGHMNSFMTILPDDTDTQKLCNLVDAFAYTITQNDVQRNIELFRPASTVKFYRAMQFLPQPPGGPLTLAVSNSVGEWGQRLNVAFATHLTDHMTLSNCEVVFHNMNTEATVDAIGYYTFPIGPQVMPPPKLTTYATSFTARFYATKETDGSWLFTNAEALANATVSVWVPFGSGTASSPGPLLSKRRGSNFGKRTPAEEWTTLLEDVQALCDAGQNEVAVATCETQYYADLMAVFDPTGSDPSNKCNHLTQVATLVTPLVCTGDGVIDESCLVNITAPGDGVGVATINMIYPDPGNADFTITGGPGITVSGGMHGITLSNDWLMEVDLSVPSDLFTLTANPATGVMGTLVFEKAPQASNAVWIAPSGGGVPVFRVLTQDDLPLIDLTTGVNNTLPVENGGTGSDAPLLGCRPMVSSCDGGPPYNIVEGPALETGEFLTGTGAGSAQVTSTILGGSGISVTLVGDDFVVDFVGDPGNVTVTLTPDLSVFEDTSADGQTLSFQRIPQTQNTVWAAPDGSNGLPVFRALVQDDLPLISLTSGVSGVLPVANGGTNSASFTGDTIIMSNTAGDTLVSGSVVGGNGIDVTTTPGTVTVELGACTTPIPGGCLDISNQACPGGPVGLNCINPDLVLNSIIVNDLTVINGTFEAEMGTQDLLNVTILMVDDIVLHSNMQCVPPAMIDPGCLPDRVKTINGIAPASPSLDFAINAGTGISISPGINSITIDNTGVTSVGLGLPASVFDVTVSPVTTTGTLTAVFVTQPANTVFAGPTSGPDAAPVFRALTLDDLPPLANGTLIIGTDMGATEGSLVGGPGISINYLGGGTLEVENTGVISVGLALPTDTFDVTVSPITSTGALTAVYKDQAANTFLAGPVSGADDTPVWRLLEAEDLPAFGNGTFLVGTGSGVAEGSLVAGPGIALNDLGSNTLQVENTGVLSVGLALPTDVFDITLSPVTSSGTLTAAFQDQAANTFFAGPISGADDTPAFRFIELDDFQALNMTDGQLLVGVTGGSPVTANLMAGAGISIMETPGNIIISAADGNGTAFGTVSFVDLSVPDIFSVSGGPVTDAGTFSVTLNSQPPGLVFASPFNVSGTPEFRPLELPDLPALTDPLDIYVGGNIATLVGGNNVNVTRDGDFVVIDALGSVSSVGLALPSSVFDVTVSPITTSGDLTAVFIDQPQGSVFAGPASGGSGTPTFRAMTTGDLPPLDTGELYIGTMSGMAPATATLTAGTGITIVPGMGTIVVEQNLAEGAGIMFDTDVNGTVTISATNTGTVTSVGLAAPVEFAVSGSPVTSTGTLTLMKNTQVANTFWAGPTSGPDAVPVFRPIALSDFTALGLQDGELLIGVTGGAPVAATLTAGPGIMIGEGMGSITISATNNGMSSEMSVDSRACLFDDFYAVITESPMQVTHTSGITWNSYISGSGAGQLPSTVGIGPAPGDRAMGVIDLFTGTSSSGHTSLLTNKNQLLAGYADLEVVIRARLSHTPTAMDDYRAYLGFFDEPETGEPTDGCYFTVNRTYSGNYWEFACRSNGATSRIMTTTMISTTAFQRFDIHMVNDGLSVVAMIDGTTVATITTNIPTAVGRYFGAGLKMEWDDNSAIRHLYVDFFRLCLDYPAPR